MGICMMVVGGVLGTYGTYLPHGLNGNLSVRVQVTGSPAYTVIAFCYLLVLVCSLTLAPIAWVYAAEVWSLETRATGMALASVANWYPCSFLSSFGMSLTAIKTLQLRNRSLHPTCLSEHLLETIHHLRNPLLWSCNSSFLYIPGNSWQDT
jgi:hypothetical protein